MLEVIFLTIAVTFLTSAQPQTKEPSDGPLIEIAATGCRHAVKPVDRPFLRELLDIERKAGWPLKHRGLLLASVCREARLDKDIAKCGDGGKSCGILQARTWIVDRYGIDRKDWRALASTYLKHVLSLKRKAKRKCPRKFDPLLVAQAWVASGPKGHTCRYSRHYGLLKRWKRKLRWTYKR